MKNYRHRIVDELLRGNLGAAGLVLIEGMKRSGKTVTAERQAKSAIRMDDPKGSESYRSLAQNTPKLLLKGSTPRAISEWCDAPALWDAARLEVEHREEKTGQFIFTGSVAVPSETCEDGRHSGIGKVARLIMRTMSLWESGESSGRLSFLDLFGDRAGEACEASELDVEQLAWLICRGGWPAALTMTKKGALKLPANYVEAIASTEISKVDGVKRDRDFTMRLLKSYARFQGSAAPLSLIYEDLKSNGKNVMTEVTICSYLAALRRIFVIEDVPAWNPALSSRTAIRTSDTRYLADPSIAAAVMGIGPDELVYDTKTMGALFETLCIRDLRIYAEALDGCICHFRDKNGLECDAVMCLSNGEYGLIEIKLGGKTLIEEGVKTLNRLAKKIDTGRMKAPSFRMVLTGTGKYAYLREDGIWVAPVGSLRP